MIRRAITILALLVGLATSALAHDIPVDLTIQAFVKPEPANLNLLVRVPMKAMVEVEFPTRGPGYIDLATADSSLRNAATLWISNQIELFEDDVRLPQPAIAAI